MSKRAKQQRESMKSTQPDDEIIKLDHWEPDYEERCEVCGHSPCVTGVKDGRVVYQAHMCGACTWGEAACLDPANW